MIEKKLVKNVLSMLTGSVAALIIGLVALPFIIRLYSPEEFGAMTALWSVVSVLAVVSCLKYEATIIIEKEEAKAELLAQSGLLLAVVVSLAVAVTIEMVTVFNGRTGLFVLEGSSLIIFIAVMFFGFKKTMESWAVRQKAFNAIAIGSVLGALASVVYKLVLGYWGNGDGVTLLIGNILGLLVPVLLVSFLLTRMGKGLLWAGVPKAESQLAMLRSYSDFPKKQMPTGLLNALQQQLPILLFAYLFDDAVIGFYGLAAAVLMRPVRLVSKSVAKVYLQHAAQKDEGKLEKDIIVVTRFLAMIAIVPFLFVGIAGEWLFSFIFGEQWAASGVMAQILSPWLFTVFINAPATQVLLVKRYLGFILKYNVCYVLARLAVVVIFAVLFDDYIQALVAFSIIGVIFNVFYIYTAVEVARHD